MIDFMQRGGWPMWPVLLLGLGAIAAALRDVDRGITRALLYTAAAGTLLDLATVLLQAQQLDERILNVGIGESLSPAILGLALLALVQLARVVSPARRLRA